MTTEINCPGTNEDELFHSWSTSWIGSLDPCSTVLLLDSQLYLLLLRSVDPDLLAFSPDPWWYWTIIWQLGNDWQCWIRPLQQSRFRVPGCILWRSHFSLSESLPVAQTLETTDSWADRAVSPQAASPTQEKHEGEEKKNAIKNVRKMGRKEKKKEVLVVEEGEN